MRSVSKYVKNTIGNLLTNTNEKKLDEVRRATSTESPTLATSMNVYGVIRVKVVDTTGPRIK